MRLERENKRLWDANLRLERECDDLATNWGTEAEEDREEEETERVNPPEERTVYCSGLNQTTSVKEKDIFDFGSKFGRVEKAQKVKHTHPY